MARRGENIHKRKDGRWEGRYIKARTSEGKIQWGYVYGTVYAEVKQVLIRKKAEVGFYNLKRTDLTFEALAEVWLRSLRNSIKEFWKRGAGVMPDAEAERQARHRQG